MISDYLHNVRFTMNISYSFMRIEDYDEIYKLWESIQGLNLSNADEQDNINKYLSCNPKQSFVCKLSEKIIGTIMCGNDGRRAFIYHLAVLPEYRRQGIASELVHLAIDMQKQLGIDKCAVFILNDNINGKRFWSGVRFSKVQEAETMARNI